MWYELGFAVCHDEREEKELAGVYSQLIGGNKFFVDYPPSLASIYDGPSSTLTCSFEEFWHVYQEGKLTQLMDRYKLRETRLKFQASRHTPLHSTGTTACERLASQATTHPPKHHQLRTFQTYPDSSRLRLCFLSRCSTQIRTN
ncbi:hypothetical protein BJY04DRAFT_194152 [Aspergillus karnatakaensis]|uniref:uncharacterized protein n=1 Tax=Aspergillus karnatakaensis TaxID=1810916 RepID=UPI003CCD2C78